MRRAFTGLIPPMISPLTPAGSVDEAGLEAHVRRLIAGGVSGLFVLGTSGEGPLLTSAQARQVIRLTVAAAAGRVPVLAGALEPSTVRTVEATLVAADCGADAAVVTTPYYIEADASGIREHFMRAAEGSPIPVVLYNIPSKTHHVLTPDIVADLVGLPNIVGIKDSHGDWAAFERLLAIRRPGFTVLQGAEFLSARSMLAGADGLVPGLSNVAPELFSAIIAAARAGSEADAHAMQAKADALGALHTHGHWLACLKYAVSRRGLTHPTTFAHAAPLTAAARSAIDALVAQQGGAT
jgi:4-hydroxy-tetrahydrodipicolinate synthase